MGLSVLPPDINLSEIKYTGKDKYIRIGLMQLKELSTEAKDSIIHERDKNGPFNSVEGFLNRMSGKMHFQDSKVLIKAGCLDSISNGINRPGLILKALEFFNKKEEAVVKTMTLFNYTKKTVPVSMPALNREDYSRSTMLKHVKILRVFTKPYFSQKYIIVTAICSMLQDHICLKERWIWTLGQ